MGRPFAEVWPEIWPNIEPIVAKALKGDGSRLEDLPLTMTRNGFAEPTWWTFPCKPLRNESGSVLVMLCTTVDTTEKVLTGRRAQREREQQQMLQPMPGFVALLRGPQPLFDDANDACQLISSGRTSIGLTVRGAAPRANCVASAPTWSAR